MASPRDPDEVDQTRLSGAPPTTAAPSQADTSVPPAPHDATIVHRPSGDDGVTLISAAKPAPVPKPVPQVEPNNDTGATRVPDVTAVGFATATVADPDAIDIGATLPTPVGRTVASGWVPGGIIGDGLSPDTLPIPFGGSDRVGTGTVIGRFALKGLHASGGLGEVFTAHDTELNREVAVKRIKSRYADDPGSRRRFLTEAELTARLDHPGVVPVFGLVNDARGRPVYAMRFIRGETLKDEIDRYHGLQKTENEDKTEQTDAKPADPGLASSPDGTPTPAVPRTVAFRQLLSRFVYVCQAIAYAHEKGIIHRDIKPANVMVGKFGEVLVVDWGLAKSLADGPDYDRIMKNASEAEFRHDPEATDLPSHVTTAGTAVGTPSYMPPEQAAGQLDKVGPKADVYSLGATLFAILTGEAPFTGKTAAETLEQVRKGAFDPPAKVNAGCPKPLDAVCRKAMARNQDDRYATAQELAADVERWLSDEPVSAYRDPFLARLARWARQHPARVATAVSLLLAGVLAAGGIAWAIHLGEKNTRAERDRVIEQEKKTQAALDKVTEQEKETAKQRDRAIDQEKKTEAERARVGLARDLARERYAKAVDAYGTLVHDLDNKLYDRAEMQEIRKTLLLNATEGLKKLVEGKGEGDIGADRTLVAAHRQMGEVYQSIGQTTDAHKQFLEAERIARVVRKEAADPNDKRIPEVRVAETRVADRDLARTLDKSAGIHLLAGNTKAAIDAIDEAIKLFEVFAADKTDVVAQQDLAKARKRRSAILLERGDTGKAADECKLALSAHKELSDAAPNDLERKRDLAASLDAVAGVQLRTGDTNGAELHARECLKLRLELAPKFPPDRANVKRELADAHTRLGEVHFDRALLTAAAKDYLAGLKVLDDLVAIDPQNAGARADRALLLGRLGHVQLRTGDIEAALANTKTNKEQCEQLLKIDPKSAKAERDLALAREQYGEALLANGYTQDGLKEYEETLKQLQSLQTLDNGSAAAKLELARGWERIGDGKIALKDPNGAVSAFAESVKIREAAERADTGSASVKRDLAVGKYKQADAYCAGGKPSLANELASAAAKLLTTLGAANPGSGQAQRDIALAYGKWGQILAGDGRSTGALIVWQSSLDRFQKLADVDRENVQAKEEEAAAWERLAGFHATAGNNDQALSSARNAVALWTALNNRDDARTKAGQRRLALAMVRCGDINADIRQLTAASDWYTKALKEVEAMKVDPLLGPVNDIANEKLIFLAAVRAGLSNPRNLADKSYDKVRIAALRTVATLEVRADHAVDAASAADELAKVATTADDLFAVARTFAGCATATRGTDEAKNSYAKSAVDALKKAIASGFRDEPALTGPAWDAVRNRAPALNEVQTELAKLRAAEK